MPTIDIFAGILSIIATDVTCIRGVDRKLTLLEIVNNFRGLTKTDIGSNSLISLFANHCGNGTVCQSGTCIAGSKIIANDDTQALIRQSVNNITFAICYGIAAFIGSYFNRQHHTITITDNNGFISESDFGNNDINSCFTNNFTFINQLSGYSADSTIRGKQTGIGDSTH